MIKKIHNNRSDRITSIAIAAVIIGIIVFNIVRIFISNTPSDAKETGYNEFMSLLDDGKVEKVEFEENDTVLFHLKDDETSYRTDDPKTDDFRERLLAAGATIEREEKSVIGKIMTLLFRIMLILSTLSIAGLLLLRRLDEIGEDSLFGSDASAKKVSFDDIIGLDEVKEDLLFLVTQMKENSDPSVRLPKGILLEGEPGNGKTMLAQAIATEADVNFISFNASDMMTKFYGETGRKVRKAFDEAKSSAPCILFIDELDSLGAKRGDASDAPEKEMNSIVATFLSKLDGVSELSGVVVIAATNRADSLDPALIRSGRFDRRFVITNPDKESRQKLVSHYIGSFVVDATVDPSVIAGETRSCSCSDIENIVNEAKLNAYKNGRKTLSGDDFETVMTNRQLRGFTRKEPIFSERDKETAAYHEAGHAIVGKFFAKKKVLGISVRSTTSGAGGYTRFGDDGTHEMAYADEVFANIVTLLGGRCAEMLKYGNGSVSFGADHDITEATKLAAVYVKAHDGIDYSVFSDVGNNELITSVKNVLRSASDEATCILEEHKNKLTLVAGVLASETELSGKQFDKLI